LAQERKSSPCPKLMVVMEGVVAIRKILRDYQKRKGLKSNITKYQTLPMAIFWLKK